MKYGDNLIKWSFGPFVFIDEKAYPAVLTGDYPSGFFGIWGRFAFRYDSTKIT